MSGHDGHAAHQRISVSQISSWNWPLEQDLAFYGERGWRRVGLHHRKLVERGWADALAAVRAADLEVTNLVATTPLRVADEAAWDSQRSRLVSLAADAAACGAPLLCTTTGPADGLAWEVAVERLERLLAPVLEDLAVPLVLEHTNPFRVDLSFLLSLRDAVAVGRRLGIGVCAETNACWSEGELDATVRSGIDTVALVQVSDFAVGTSCTADRTVVGDGDIPWPRVLGLFEDAGYAGPYDIEMIGPRIEAEGYASALPRCVDALGGVLSGLAA